MRDGRKLVELAAEDEARGRMFTAGVKLNRAATYYQTAERMQAHGDAAPRVLSQPRHLPARVAAENYERVEIPYVGAHIAGLYVRAEGARARRRSCCVNGLDSSKEMNYRVGLPRGLAKRGVSTLNIDQPGTGEALRAHG